MNYFFIVAVMLFAVTLQDCNGQNAETISNRGKETAERAQNIGVGVAYERWGQTACPSGAELVYEGFVAGGWKKTEGSGASYLCLPFEPVYINEDAVQLPSYIYSTQYSTNNQIFSNPTHNFDAPCVVCYVERSAKLMMPATTSCPGTWNTEYSGYLMSTRPSDLINTEYICVDQYAEVLFGSDTDRVGCVMNFVAAYCAYSFLTCPPYKDQAPITCAVCTR